MYIMVINCGSSSLKFQLISFPEETVIAKGLIERIGQEAGAQFTLTAGDESFTKRSVDAQDHTKAVTAALEALTAGNYAVLKSKDEINAFGHRVVHGGEKFTHSVIIDDEVLECIEECSPLAPLHNPANLAGIYACKTALPNVPNVAVFDTAFHQTIPEHAFYYAIPYEYYEKDHIRRYGFHGTSHKFVTEAFAEKMGKEVDEVSVITCHIGNGSSLTAVENGKSVDTTMGFTPLAGVVMGTRCGDIDPAIVFYLMENNNMTAKDVDILLNKESGLLGFSGVSSDMRDILEASKNGNERAEISLKICAYSIAKYIGTYVALLPKTDAIIFTAGIGENSNEIRKMICGYLKGLGLSLDPEKNMTRGKACCVSDDNSSIPIWIIPTNEELAIARETRNELSD